MLNLLVFLKGDSNHIEINADVILCKKIQQFLKISDFFTIMCQKYENRLPEKSNKKSRKTGKFLARATGLEPVTYGLTVRCSTD